MYIKIKVASEPTERELKLIQDTAMAITRKQGHEDEELKRGIAFLLNTENTGVTKAITFLMNKDREDQKDFEQAVRNANAALVAAHNMQRALKEEFLKLVKYADFNVRNSSINYNDYSVVATYMSGIRVKVGGYEETVLPPDPEETHIGGISVYVRESTAVEIFYPEVDSYKSSAYGVDYTTEDFMKYEVKVTGGYSRKHKDCEPYITDSASDAMRKFVEWAEPKLIK